MVNRYHAEVIGSLLRPQYLKDARKQWEAGQLSTREFKRSEDRAVDEMITLQERSGVDVITDGEMRRSHFIAPLTDVITGVKSIPAFTRVWRRAQELAGLGCEYIQIDAPELGMLCDPERRRQDFADRGMDPDRLLAEGIDILNSVTEVAGVTFALHVCRGNNKGYYVGEGGYEPI